MVIWALREHPGRPPEVVETREALEVKPAELAAARRSGEVLAAIDDALAFLELKITEGSRSVRLRTFHRAITAAAHSSLLARLMGEFAELIRKTV